MAPIHKSRLGKAPIGIDSDDSDDIDVDPSDDDDEECNGGKIDDIVLGIHRKMVLYLDYVDFGSRNVDQDEVDDFNYGLRPIKDFHSTCYFKPEPAHSRSNSIRANLDSAVGTLVPDLLKDRISEMFSEYCCSHHIVDTDSLEELLVSIISLLAESSKSAHLQHQTEHHAPIITEDGPSNSQPTSLKGKQCHNPVLNPDYVGSVSKDTSVAGAGISYNSVPRSGGENCASLQRIAEFYGSSANGHGDKISVNNLTMHKSFIPATDANVDVSHHSRESNGIFPSMDCENVNIDASGNANAPSCLDGQHFVTPDVSYLRNRNNFLNEGSSVAALSLVKNVANKFRLRFANFNNRSSILGEDIPSFKLLDSDDDVSDFDEKNELCGDATPSSSQHCISFHSVEDTPEYMIPGNQNLGSNKRSNSQNVNKRIFQDLTNSPDVQLLGESKFNDRCKKLCTNTDDFYNACNNLCKSNQDLSSSGGKLPLHGPRRVVIPARVASDPFVTNRLRFSITDEERRYYIAVCRLAESSKWQSYYAIDIDNVKTKFYSFGNSLKKGGSVSHYVISVFCRVMFHNNHPTRSKKNYFFHLLVNN